MSSVQTTISEALFKELCLSSGVRCELVATGAGRTPDFRIWAGDNVEVFCEVKQIDLNAEDRADTADDDASGETVGRLVPNRIRKKLKHVSAQLEGASRDGHPTLVVIYDNTDLGNTMESDVLQALFGQDSVTVTMSEKSAVVSGPFFGRNQGLTKTQNTSVSAVAILDRSDSGLAFRVYRNPHAVVVLRPEVLAPFPVSLRY